MSVLQMARVFRGSKSKGVTRLVALALADVANDEGDVTAYGRSHKVLAGKANCDEGSVGRAITKLIELGEVELLRKGDGRRSSDYRLTIPEPEGAQPEGVQDATPAPAGCDPRGGDTRAQGVQDALPITPSSSVPDQPLPSPSVDELFEEFWAACPKRTGKGDARRAYTAALKRASAAVILEGMKRYAEETRGADQRYLKTPGPWLRAERWLDEPGANRRNGASSGPGPRQQVGSHQAAPGRVTEL